MPLRPGTTADATNGFEVVDALRFIESPRPCSYLPEETASLEYRFVAGLTADSFGQLLRRGWRRHGMAVFRPRCAACVQCRSLRVPVERFKPSKSQRRIAKKNEGTEIRLSRAGVSPEHIALYNAYHADMHERRGWRPQETTLDEYASAFLAGDAPFAHELQYLVDGRLVGVGLIDLTPAGMSSVYFYHDPALRAAALGVFSMLCEVDLCRRLGIAFLYLGYWIERCPSMAYKADYRPHEVLERYVADHEEPRWIDASPAEPRTE